MAMEQASYLIPGAEEEAGSKGVRLLHGQVQQLRAGGRLPRPVHSKTQNRDGGVKVEFGQI